MLENMNYKYNNEDNHYTNIHIIFLYPPIKTLNNVKIDYVMGKNMLLVDNNLLTVNFQDHNDPKILHRLFKYWEKGYEGKLSIKAKDKNGNLYLEFEDIFVELIDCHDLSKVTFKYDQDIYYKLISDNKKFNFNTLI